MGHQFTDFSFDGSDTGRDAADTAGLSFADVVDDNDWQLSLADAGKQTDTTKGILPTLDIDFGAGNKTKAPGVDIANKQSKDKLFDPADFHLDTSRSASFDFLDKPPIVELDQKTKQLIDKYASQIKRELKDKTGSVTANVPPSLLFEKPGKSGDYKPDIPPALQKKLDKIWNKMTKDAASKKGSDRQARKGNKKAADKSAVSDQKANKGGIDRAKHVKAAKDAPQNLPKKKETVLPHAKFKDAATKIFGKIDLDNNGYLSTKELAKAVQNPAFKGKDAQVVAAMYKNRKGLRNLHDDPGFDSKGISKNDLQKFGKRVESLNTNIQRAGEGITWAELNRGIKRWDANKDGKLSKDEIKRVLAKAEKDARSPNHPTNDSEYVKTFKYMLKNYDTIKKASNDQTGWETQITKKDLDKHFGNMVRKRAYDSITNGVKNTLKEVAKNQTDKVSKDLYGDRQNPLKSITSDAVKQGNAGTCGFLSCLASLAKQNPQAIKDMIKDNKNGTYTVTFPGDKKQPITVKNPTDAELGLFSKASKHGIWAPIMEKAYGKYCQKNLLEHGIWRAINDNNLPQESGEGSTIRPGIKLLTGGRTNIDNLALTANSTTRQNLIDAMSNRRIVIAGIGRKLADVMPDKINKMFNMKPGAAGAGFYTMHAYSILGFDPQGKDGGTVTIRNPWGGKDGTTRGKIQISFKQFCKIFSRITYQTR